MIHLDSYIDTLSPEKRALLEILLQEQATDTQLDSFPLSFAQQRLWFLSLLEPESPAYNLPAALHVRGSLDRQALEQSLAAIAQRHETLRTTFDVIAGEPSQIIHAELPVPMDVMDLTHLEGAERDEQVRQLASADGSSIRGWPTPSCASSSTRAPAMAPRAPEPARYSRYHEHSC